MDLPGPAPESLQQALRILRGGGVLAYPTEGCFGLGCNPRSFTAVRRILGLKRRHWRQGLILVGARWQHIAPWVDTTDSAAVARARASWPGPYTWLLPARAGVSRWLRGEHDTIAVRVTAHPLASALCRGFNGAIVSTSANRHGGEPAVNAVQVRRLFGQQVDMILPGRLSGRSGPTEIRDARTGDVLRAG